MGFYLNPGNGKFLESINSDIYVDKTGLIAQTNSAVRTRGKFLCVSRPRRFGKSMAAEMLAAYYGSGIDSSEMFAGFEIASDPTYEQHLNKYDVIFINMIDFLDYSDKIEEMLDNLSKKLLADIKRSYKDIDFLEPDDLITTLQECYMTTGKSFVILIDEWDCVFRLHQKNKVAQKAYLDYLRKLFKDREYVALAYMTGILPIHKYGAHSALNMFEEFSMISPGKMSRFMGFTQEEVDELCHRYGRNIEAMKVWYNGYRFRDVPAVYSPQSVIRAILSNEYGSHWTQTETYEALQVYIKMDFNGLRDAIIELLADGTKRINTSKFANDMVTFNSFQDVLTLLIHLGYLGFEAKPSNDGILIYDEGDVFIPNKEIAKEYVNSIEDLSWGSTIANYVINSQELLEALWRGDQKATADGIQSVHMEASHLTYNNENALANAISLALFAAREYYTIIRELPAGKGFAYLAFIPRPNHPDKPAMLIELKWDKKANTALTQIQDKQYPEALKNYANNILLAGITYEKDTREHTCIIKRA